MKNYSRQREAILEVLRATDTHPTANRIYMQVRETIPNISLGTVYRNLSALCESGEIISLRLSDGYEHYDGNIAPHAHLFCKECGKIFDTVLERDFLSDTARKNGFICKNSVYIVYGICSECSTKENFELTEEN